MGIVSNTKQFLKRKTTELAKKAADGLVATSALSPKQLEIVEQKRKGYLSQKPDMNGEAVREIIEKNLGAVGIEVYQAYLKQLKNVYKPVNAALGNFDELNRIRYFNITKWVTNSKEKNLDKLVNVYQVLSEEDCNIALIYHRTKEKCEVTLGVVNTDINQPDPAKIKTYDARLESAILGNFPGAELRTNKGNKDSFGLGIPVNLQSVIKQGKDGKDVKSVAVVSNLASEKSEDFISQSMEKLLDGIIPQNETEDYTIVLLAKPISNQLESKNRLFELYSALAPYASWQTNHTYTESDGVSSSANFGVNLGMSAGTHSVVNMTKGTSIANAVSKGSSDSVGAHVGTGLFFVSAGSDYNHTWQRGTTNTTGSSESTGISSEYNVSTNFGVSFSRSSSVTAQIGFNDGITQNYTNYGVVHTLEIIESQLKRIEESSALGMWEFASYVIAESPVIANNVAHMYLALTQGEESFMTSAAINLWDGELDKEDAQTILANVQKLQHPVFGLKDTLEEEWLLYPTLVTPSAVLSGKELARALNFPKKSVSGLPVLESVAFGRDVQHFTAHKESDNSIKVGQIYHMRKVEKNTPVNLDLNSLCSHTFITGATGTGKSNFVYQMIYEIYKRNKHFLVIEPAKGEYKNVFGGYDDVQVYGTNPNYSKLLHINPFSFPPNISVLEHIDRLVEIFNACWPMYAAMPAVLKDAIEKIYKDRGWIFSNPFYYSKEFPNFMDLIKALPEVMENSLYSADTKSDYSGALITRVKSLTNGINGEIFCSKKEISNEELFDKNVIVDISRVGSMETKSLIMGILVMKLQEYRLQPDNMNKALEHVTVLEEAHNLLRRTSFSQSQESSNLQGKSVEMITNAIAEMRTYGEGFIIADQAPELLDEAVIRNTSTKIILRLPDESDCLLAGKSIALTDEQIKELAKLPDFVAAIYQNDWVEAVLCKSEEFTKSKKYTYNPKESLKSVSIRKLFVNVFDTKEKSELSKEDIDNVKEWIELSEIGKTTKQYLYKALKGNNLSEDEKKLLAYNIFGFRTVDILLKEEDTEKAMNKIYENINKMYNFENDLIIENIKNYMILAINEEKESEEIARELAQKYGCFGVERRVR